MSPPTIFVSVASYCDPLLRFTLASARSQASRPDRLFFGVVEQAAAGQALRLEDEWSRAHLRFTRIDALEARGPCWARALAMALYQGEDWFLQIDSHTWFEPGWDDRLVSYCQRATRAHPRSLLTCYPNPFVWVDGAPVARPVTPHVLAFVVAAASQFGSSDPVLGFECVPVETRSLVEGFHLAAGCLFAPGRIVTELPYDPQLYFHGEEQAYALRAWTHGWQILHMPGMPMYHLYTAPGAAPRPMHWSPEADERRAVRSATLDAAARRRLRAMLWDGAELGVYGLGTERTLADYAAFSGIDYAARCIEPRARKSRFGY
jgi:hypothetical protein